MRKKRLVERITDKNRFLKMIYLFGLQLKADNVSSYAASCAFFIFLSLVPMVILVCSILPYTPLKEEDLLFVLQQDLPETMSGVLSAIVSEVYGRSIGVLSIAVITTLWSAGKGVNALIMGLNAIEHIENKRNTIVMRIFSSLYTLIFLASIVVFLVLSVYGRLLGDKLLTYFPKMSGVFKGVINFRSVITIVLMIIVFMILYAVLPDTKMKIRMQFVGALFASISWTLFSFLFSLYVENYDAFTMYGSFTTIIVLLFWLYACMYLVFIGANLNKYLRPLTVLVDKRFKERNQNRGQSESLEE